jgi:hypothetical protein
MQIHVAVSAALKRVLSVSVNQTLIDESLAEKNISMNRSSAPLNATIQIIASVLQLKCQAAWPYILDGF